MRELTFINSDDLPESVFLDFVKNTVIPIIEDEAYSMDKEMWTGVVDKKDKVTIIHIVKEEGNYKVWISSKWIGNC